MAEADDSTASSLISLDLTSVTNVLLPLDLYKHEPFLAEQSFDLLTAILKTHLDHSPVPMITQGLLFAICDILCQHTRFSPTLALPAVLRRLRTWRVLPPEERRMVLDNLALDLASLVNHASLTQDLGNDPPPFRRPLRIRWIRADSGPQEIDEGMAAPRLDEAPDVAASSADHSESLVPQHQVCRDVRHHEYVQFRSGCCACRQPRTLPWELPASCTGGTSKDKATMTHGCAIPYPDISSARKACLIPEEVPGTAVPSIISYRKSTCANRVISAAPRPRKDMRKLAPPATRSTAATLGPSTIDENRAPAPRLLASVAPKPRRSQRISPAASRLPAVLALPEINPSSEVGSTSASKAPRTAPSLSASSFLLNIKAAATGSTSSRPVHLKAPAASISNTQSRHRVPANDFIPAKAGPQVPTAGRILRSRK